MNTETLSSNVLNYLIWRYLQVSGFGHAAIELSKAWNRDPEALPFASRITSRQLVDLVQDGLKLDAIKAEATGTEKRYTFGDDHGPKWSIQSGDPENLLPYGALLHPPNGQTVNGQLQSTHDTETPIPPDITTRKTPARKRKGTVSKEQRPAEVMEVDTNGMSHLSIAATEGAISDAPSPAVEEPPPPPPTTKEIGESRMTQSERLQQLKPEATILNIAPPELHIQKPQAVQIDHATFSPSEPNALLLAGDHLARIYLIPTNMNSTTVPDPSSGNLYLDVAGLTPNFRVLACAWIAPLDGAALAVWETHRNEKGDIRHKGRLVQVGKVSGTSDAFAVTRTLANHIRDVVALRWNPSSRSLLCLSITDKGSIIRAWTDDFEESIPLFQTKWQLYDVQWISRTQFVACGEAISIFDINHTAEGYRIKCIHDSLDDRDSIRLVWHRLAYDPNTSMIAAISLDGPDLALLDAPSGERSVAYQNAPFAAPAESAEDISSRKYYSYEIPVDDAASAVAVAFQPIQNPVSLAPDAPRLLATALDDGLIIILDARRRWNIITWLALGMGKAVEACAWSGDGFLLAAAGGGRVVVWRAEDILAAKGQVKSVVPRAVWVVAQERKWGESRAVVRKGTPAPGAVQPQLTEGDKQERAETEKEKEKTNEVNGATVPNGVDHSAMDIDVQLRPHNNGVNEARSESDYGEDKVSQLIWDQDGKKLIYTTGDQVAVINLRS